nr:hypothetical protein [Enterobacter sp. 262D3]
MLTDLSMTAVRKYISFNKNRFFIFHHNALYHYTIKGMLAFTDISLVAGTVQPPMHQHSDGLNNSPQAGHSRTAFFLSLPAF